MNLPAGPTRAIIEAYRSEWARLGKPPQTRPLAGVSRHVVIAERESQALEIARRAYPQWLASLLLLWEQRGISAPFIGYPPSADEAMAGGWMFAGTADSVRARIEELVAATEISYLLCRFAFGEMPVEAALASVELFAGEVMPAFEAVAPPA